MHSSTPRERSARSASWVARSLVVVALGSLGLAGRAHADDALLTPARVWAQRCSACHTFGKGIKVGPDLKGVNERHPREWLMRFIRSSASVIDSGDPAAIALYERFNKIRMPDWLDLSELQVAAMLDWLAADGPERQRDEDPSAESAVETDVSLGRALFHGATRLASGGVPCASCHRVRDAGEVRGGSFAGDLSRAYVRFQDRALTLFMRRPCFPRLPESALAVFLQPAESFALRAYLRQAAFAPDGRTP